MRHITSTLEGVRHASLPDAPAAGRLTHDVDPPGFESFSSLIPGGIVRNGQESRRGHPTHKSVSVVSNTRRKAVPASDRRPLEQKRQSRIAAARISLQEAKRSLIKANQGSKCGGGSEKARTREETEKLRREARLRFEKAKPRQRMRPNAQSVAAGRKKL